MVARVVWGDEAQSESDISDSSPIRQQREAKTMMSVQVQTQAYTGDSGRCKRCGVQAVG